jgi:hypothetical protein
MNLFMFHIDYVLFKVCMLKGQNDVM